MELGTNIPFIHSILSSRLIQALAGPKPEDQVGLGALIGVAQKVVKERFDPTDLKSERERDMLDAFIKHGLTQLEAESESALQILAGSDSTATSIRVTLLYLLTNPPCYIRLLAEIDAAIANGNISHPVVSSAEAQKLPYLQACIKEGLRMWQPLNGIVTKVAPKEGATINDIFIPGGTQVCFSKHCLMRRKDIFGPDADVFLPERWLTDDAETLKGYERVWDLSFGSGRFSCLGKGVALMELNKVFVEVCIDLSNFGDYADCFAASTAVRFRVGQSCEYSEDEVSSITRTTRYEPSGLETNRIIAINAGMVFLVSSHESATENLVSLYGLCFSVQIVLTSIAQLGERTRKYEQTRLPLADILPVGEQGLRVHMLVVHRVFEGTPFAYRMPTCLTLMLRMKPIPIPNPSIAAVTKLSTAAHVFLLMAPRVQYHVHSSYFLRSMI